MAHHPGVVKGTVYGMRHAAGSGTAFVGAEPEPSAGQQGKASSAGADGQKSAAGGASSGKPLFTDSPDYYKALNAERFSTDSDIKKSYRKLVLQWHPDKHPSNREEAEEKIRLINNAYETLGNPLKRQAYDQQCDALERKRRGVRLETSMIQPRMSIPKEFLLCPLGHAEKFVRVVGSSLQVHSRDDAPGMFYKDFFASANFTLWWLPEVSNMCRLRSAESAGVGVDGGLNLNFMLQSSQPGVVDADVSLSGNVDPGHANLIAVASPYAQGAFRFEGAFYPGHYLSFRPPSSIRMASLVDEENDIADFILEDHQKMFKYMTMDEILAPAVESQGAGEFVKLSDIRADMTVRLYFQTTLGCQPWTNSEFSVYFEGHYDAWEFDAKRARVRVRPRDQRLLKRLQKADHKELLQTVLCAGPELEALPLQSVVPVVSKLSEMLLADLDSASQCELDEAQKRLLTALPMMPSEGVPLGLLVYTARNAKAMGSASIDARMVEVRKRCVQSLSATVSARLGEVTLEMLNDVLELPLAWKDAAGPLCRAIAPMLAAPRPCGEFTDPLRLAVKAGPEALPIAEALARRELSVLHLAVGDTAAKVLQTLIECQVLTSEASAQLKPPVLDRISTLALVDIIAALAECCGESEELRSSITMLAAADDLSSTPPASLLRLAVAATKSHAVAEGLGPVAAAAATTLSSWTFDDVAKLLLAVAKTKGAANGSGGHQLFERAVEVLTPKLAELSSVQLIKTSLGVNGVEQCRPLLAAIAKEAVSRLSDLKQSQLLLLTRGLLPLGCNNPHVEQIVDFWSQSLEATADKDDTGTVSEEASVGRRRAELEAKTGLPADQLAQLAQLLVPIVDPQHVFLEVVSKKLIQEVINLSEAARSNLLALFSQGSGPIFPSKAELLRLLATPCGRSKSRSRETSLGQKRSRQDSPSTRRSLSNEKLRKRESRRQEHLKEDDKKKEDSHKKYSDKKSEKDADPKTGSEKGKESDRRKEDREKREKEDKQKRKDHKHEDVERTYDNRSKSASRHRQKDDDRRKDNREDGKKDKDRKRSKDRGKGSVEKSEKDSRRKIHEGDKKKTDDRKRGSDDERKKSDQKRKQEKSKDSRDDSDASHHKNGRRKKEDRKKEERSKDQKKTSKDALRKGEDAKKVRRRSSSRSRRKRGRSSSSSSSKTRKRSRGRSCSARSGDRKKKRGRS